MQQGEDRLTKQPVAPRTRLWQRPLPLQRQDSNRNDFIDKEFISRLKGLPNILPEGLEWLDYRPEMCPAIAGDPPKQFQEYISRRMSANPPHLILMIADTLCKEGKSDVRTADGRDATIVGMMISEAFDVINQGKSVPTLTIGGLAIAEPWRGMGLVLNFVKRGASRVSGEHMHLFNLKKDRRLFPCAELSVWWYPLKPATCKMMTLFRLDPGPPSTLITALCDRVSEEYAALPCREMTFCDVDTVCRMLREEAANFSLARFWTSEHVARWLLPKDDVQFSYVVTDETGTKDLDFFSFHIVSYCVPNSKSIDQTECLENEKGEEKVGTREIRMAVPGYLTTQHTRKEDIVKFIMHAAKQANVDYIHGYGAFSYEETFNNLGFTKNENEVHYLQMFNWETRSFKGEEIGLAWIQF
ncbi:hypothetical protein ACHWQZ_G003028 [Mnemiopsis leidyi]